MDFMNRNQQSNSGRPGTIFSAGAPSEAEQPAPHEEHKPKAEKHEHGQNGPTAPIQKWFRWGGGAAVIVVAILIAAALALFISFKPASEAELVNTDKLQAVFLTNDQVYFGKITSVNSKYIVLTNIYYLQTSSGSTATKTTAASNNISLVKLGCELHKPQDQMVISQEQVSFWENLQTDGQVAKAVASYQAANKSGQKCDTTNQTANPVQGGADTTNNTTNNTNSNTTNTNSNSNSTNSNTTNNTNSTNNTNKNQ